jgi:hypothetical protein
LADEVLRLPSFRSDGSGVFMGFSSGRRRGVIPVKKNYIIQVVGPEKMDDTQTERKP